MVAGDHGGKVFPIQWSLFQKQAYALPVLRTGCLNRNCGQMLGAQYPRGSLFVRSFPRLRQRFFQERVVGRKEADWNALDVHAFAFF